MRTTTKTTSKPTTNSNQNDLRNGYTRYLGAAHIIGELLHRYISKDTLNITYSLTTAYILADTFNQCNKVYEKDGFTRQVGIKAGDVLTWHSFASILIPGYIVNRIKSGTKCWLMSAGASCALRRYLPFALGLISIPIIMPPTDRLVEHLMSETYRKYIK